MKSLITVGVSCLFFLLFPGLFHAAHGGTPPVVSVVQVPVHGRVYTVTVTAGANDLDYLRISWHDRTPDYLLNVILPAGESIVVTHEFPRSLRVVPILIEIREAGGSVTEQQITPEFQPVNELPVPNADQAATPENSPVTIRVLANDADADHDLLTLSSVGRPRNGSAVKNRDNTVTYTPNPGYRGPDSFPYTIWDGYQAAIGTVTVTVGTPIPVAHITASQEAIMVGDTVTLSWSTAWAERVSIDQGVGQVSASGSLTVSPSESTTYKITAAGAGGTASAQVAIPVVTPVFRGDVIVADDQRYQESWFGAAAAVSGDYAVIGAPLADVAGREDCGAAYVFKREGNGWRQQAKLAAAGGQAWDYFGSSVALSGDYAIIGASYAGVAGQYPAGAAYIFKRQGESWIEQARLTAPHPAAGEYFGHAVAISGDHAMVGVDTRNDNLYTPKVYIFHLDGASWNCQAELSPSDPESYWHFGNSVAISGGYAAIGAPYNFFDGDRGAVYLYEYDGSAWQERAVLTAGDGGSRDNFGSSVALAGDYLIAGAINHDLEGPDGGEGEGETLLVDNGGAAYVFKRGEEGWLEQARLTAGDAADQLNFGLAVAITGEYAVVGADHNFNNGANPLSSNYVFKRYGARWVEQKTLNAGYATRYDEFGPYLGLSDNYMVIGNYWSGSALNTGIAYLYDLPRVTADLSAAPMIDPHGESVLTWHADNAASCSIAPGIGAVAVNGSIPVKVGETTTYTLTAAGPLGTATAQARVTVGYPAPEIAASASVATIRPGETVTLSWATTPYTDSVMIDNGVGMVPATGAVEVSPAATTTYTLTATGSGGVASQAVTITVLPPEVNLSAAPLTIERGAETVLTWNSSGAQNLSIDNGIGVVSSSGTLAVSPAATTTYAITATGPSGTTTASVTVQVRPPRPAASLVAEPAALLAGQQTTLTWETAGADTVRFGYGLTEFPVGPTGSLTLTPSATTTYRVEAANPSGTTAAAVTVQVLDPSSLGVAITSPKQGETLRVPQLLVQGLVTAGTDEVGVTVNSVPAQVNGNRFFANNVALVEGENTITVRATTPDGATLSENVTVFVDTVQPAEWIELVVNPDSGAAPLAATLKAEWHLSFAPENTWISVSDPGQVVVTPTGPAGASLSFLAPGLHTITYTAADIHGTEYQQMVMVNVLDRPALDTLLKTRWDAMKSRLAAGDAEGGLGYFLAEAREKYRPAFTALAGQLPQLAGDMQGIERVYARDDRAKFRINRQHDQGGAPVVITYYIYFVKDENGLWKIEQF